MTKHFRRPRWLETDDGLPKGLSMVERVEEYWVGLDALTPYAVSSYGRVMNIDTGMELRQHTGKDGRMRVTIRRTLADGTVKKHTLFVHRWVAMAFFVNYQPDIEINHINGIYADNSVLNLTLGEKRCREGDDLREG